MARGQTQDAREDGARVELGSQEFWDQLAANPARLAAEVCAVDVTNLDLTLQQHPALRAWVNATHEVARIEEERAKYELTKVEATTFMAVKKVLDADTGKAKTVDALKAEVAAHPDVLAAQEALINAQEKRAVLRAMADALEDRLQMLIQIAAKQRKELEDYGR